MRIGNINVDVCRCFKERGDNRVTSILKSVVHRLLWAIVVLLGLSVLIFSLLRIIPGDPARMALGETASEEAVERYREEMHYNDPLPTQYYYWLKGVLKGDFGQSIVTKRKVSQDISEFLPATLELVLWAGIPPILLTLFLGTTAARNKNKWQDYLIRFTGYIAIATPSFVWAVFLLLIFGYWFPILPSIGGRLSLQYNIPSVTKLMLIDCILAGNLNAAWDAFLHLILPAIALCISHVMQESRIVRSSMVDNSGKDYITMMTSQGVPAKTISNKYLLRPSIISAVSIMGLDIAGMFGNAFLVESIFNWPGLSRYALKAITGKDINAVCAVVLIYGVIFIFMNFIVDTVVLILDPRMRQKRAS